MTPMRAGIIHQPHGQANMQCLPLEEVTLKAWVVDVSSRIVLTQTFHNLSHEPTGRAKYVFPLPASAAVCAFELELENGFVIVGKVKEKEEAARMFSSALNHGKTAALVERVTDDIFTISVGSIPATIARLTFIMDLLDEGLRDHVRLQLPMHIAGRYGTPPEALNDASAAGSKTRVCINIDIQCSDIIDHIGCPTHEGVAYRRYKHAGGKSQRRMSAVWKSSELLTTDFVLTIYSKGLDKPRCFAEALGGREYGDVAGFTIAMQLTLVPKFFAPGIPSQEYIFIIDRSFSMSDAPIDTAKRTLIMLLRLLPSSQTTFNIFSFGRGVISLWPSSHILEPGTLSEATAHVASMDADLGPGTDIPMALQAAFNSRVFDRPAAVFLLTDGQVYGNEVLNPWAVIASAIQKSPPSAQVRLFVLGIGAGVSSDVCSSLARQGNGEYMFALSTEDIVGKCAQLLNAGRSKNIERIDVRWGDDSPRSPQVSFSSPTIPEGILALAPPPPIQQAPHTLTRIFSGIRFTVFAITSFKTMPTSVRLTIKLEGIAEAQELTIKVMRVKPFHGSDQDSVIPMVHTLAARRLIMELDDGIGPLPTPTAGDTLLATEDDLRKAGIVRLGLTYQLISEHTSFIADEARARSTRRQRSRGWARSRLQRGDASTDTTEDIPAAPTASEDPSFLNSFIDSVASFVTSVFGFFVGTADTMPSSNSLRQRSDLAGSRGSLSLQSTETLSTLSSVDGSTSCSACWTPSRSPSPRPRYQDLTERAPSPEFLLEENDQNDSAPRLANTKRRVPISQEVYDLFREMNLDGSYSATPLLVGPVGDAVLAKRDEHGVDKKVWATAVVMAYMQKHLQGEPDLLDLLMEKSHEFIQSLEAGRGNGSGNKVNEFEQMVREAMQLLSS